MQVKLVLIVIDKGDTFQITGISVQPNDFIADKTVHVMPFSDKPLFDKIKQLIKTNRVEYENPLNGKLIENDLIITPLDQFEIDKKHFMTKGMDYMSSKVKIGAIFDFFNFAIANNKLLDKGFIVTDENRADKYLEIVVLGDDKLIGALETFLITRDRLLEQSSFYTIWKKYNDNIENAMSRDEMKYLYKEFINIFE